MVKPCDEASAENNRGKRLEYELLRNEILAMGRTCVLVLGFLLTVTATLVGIALERHNPLVAWMISPLWIIGYFYLSEMRFGIIKIAYYLRTQIEGHSSGLGWETWLNDTGDNLKKIFLRWNPYLLETTATLFVVSANLFFVAYLNHWKFRDPSVWSLWIFEILLLVMIIRALTAYFRKRPK